MVSCSMTLSRDEYQAIATLIRQRASQDAQTRLEAALQHAPSDPWLKRQLAEVLLKLDDTYRAGPLLRALLVEQPNHPRVHTLAGERHRREGNTREATEAYLNSLELREDPYVRTRAIDGLLQLKRFGEAEQLIDAGLKRHGAEDAYLLRRKARLLSATDRRAEAADILAQTARDPARPSDRDYVEALKLRLESLEPSEQRAEVMQLLKVSTHGQNPYLLSLAAELAIDQDDPETAKSLLEQARTLAEDDPYVGKTLGFQYNRLGCFERVLDTLGPAFVLEPRDIVVQQVLFAAARKSKNLARLQTIFTLAYDRHPGFHKLSGLIKKVTRALEAPPEDKPASAPKKRRKRQKKTPPPPQTP